MPIPRVSKELFEGRTRDVMGEDFNVAPFTHLYCHNRDCFRESVAVVSVAGPIRSDNQHYPYRSPCPRARLIEVDVYPVITNNAYKSHVRLE